ncbi:hypothetical protein CLOM_g2111 [Closterium sp. NIES-68]|nr:hypothetical protein CLOM_g2111 [Closterium sp. NIES-68]
MNERGGDANGRGAVPEKTSEPPPSKVEALDGSNYEEWSGRMRSAFKRYKLLKIAMFEHIKDLVEADDSGPRAWKLLRDVIQPNTLPMVIVLEKELAAISMRPGDDVKPVLDKIKDTYARMAAAGSSVSQLQQCTKIISVLDNSWDNLIPTLNSQQDQWTPEWLRQQILQEDFRRRHGTCWYCKKIGHPWFKCFSRPEGWAPPGMKPPSGERAQGGAVQGSGAQDLLDEVKPPGKIKYVAAASGALLHVIGVGNAKVKGANGELVGLGNVLLVEGLSANLLSVRRLQKSKAEVTFGPTSCRAKLGKKVLWSLEEETSCIKDLWQLPIIPWNGKTPTAATAAVAKATAGGDATAPTDGVLEAVKKVQKQQTHSEVLAGVDASAAWAKASSRSGEADWETWHERLCHVNFPMLQKLVKDGSLKGLEVALVKNRVLATIGDKEWIPYVKWYGSAPAVNMLRAFRCMVVFHVPKEKRGKFEASGRWGVHLGIAKDHKGWLLWDLTTQKLTVSRDVKFLESLYYKEWKQQQQKLPSTPLIVEVDEVQRPSRQVEVAVSEEEMSGVTEEGGAAEVEQQQQQQHESPPRVPHPPERPRRDVRPPVRLTYGGRGKPNVVQAGSVVEQIEEDEIALCYWAAIPQPKVLTLASTQ